MLALIDNNFAQRPCFDEYLAESSENFAVLSQTVLQEWLKVSSNDSGHGIRNKFKIACKYPRQILVLKDTDFLLRNTGNTIEILERLIDFEQTSNFFGFCSTLINVPFSDDIREHLAPYENDAMETAKDLKYEAQKMFKLFRRWRFKESEIGFSRKVIDDLKGMLIPNKILAPDTIGKIFEKIGSITRTQLKNHDLDIKKLATNDIELANLLSFRYAVMTLALFIYFEENGGMYPTEESKLSSWLYDLKIAAQATYFDDFKTNDKKLFEVYKVGLRLIIALGGYYGCGNYSENIKIINLYNS